MANSYIEYSTAGTGTNGMGQTTFSYSSVDVLNANDIKVFGVKLDGTREELPINSRDASAKTVTLVQTPAAWASNYISKIRVYRQTTSNALVDFVDGARLTESDLDTAYKQGLFVAQEVSEDAGQAGTQLTNVTDLTLSGTTTVVNLTATGTVSIPTANYAKAYVTNSGAQTLSANTLTDVVLNDEQRDNANAFANNTFTPPVTGYYCIQGQVEVTCTDPNDLSHVEIQIDKSGSPMDGTIQSISETHASNSNMTKASVSTFVIEYLATNQPIKLRVKANCGAGTLQIVAQRAALGIFQLA
ncbi:MAG: hypothetical protein CBC27_00800 [Opitutia bacterium TMED67]|nr:MAG: hypothetical protein CBC27_03375 [Opitutae bacterium TMED67]OUU77303.1 MAG: hypothetical protein CBC27_00800 [Opitutae bacterium TMED67]|tara:strand:+ start:32 stop:934 length:903 start_codon:yes stop_codon:yes gene_type:complete